MPLRSIAALVVLTLSALLLARATVMVAEKEGRRLRVVGQATQGIAGIAIGALTPSHRSCAQGLHKGGGGGECDGVRRSEA